MAYVKFTGNSPFRPDPKKAPVAKIKTVKIKPLSDKRAKQNRAYLTLRKVYLENNKTCAIKLKGCTKKATEIHHSEKRTGALLTNIEFFVATCRSCHTKVENDNIKFENGKR